MGSALAPPAFCPPPVCEDGLLSAGPSDGESLLPTPGGIPLIPGDDRCACNVGGPPVRTPFPPPPEILARKREGTAAHCRVASHLDPS
jgi:hypothetical protein